MTDIYDLIIIGGGPAGITAGIYAARKKLKTFLVDVEEMPNTIKARSLNEAVKIAERNLGVMEK